LLSKIFLYETESRLSPSMALKHPFLSQYVWREVGIRNRIKNLLEALDLLPWGRWLVTRIDLNIDIPLWTKPADEVDIPSSLSLKSRIPKWLWKVRQQF
jgi:hypothetical protein